MKNTSTYLDVVKTRLFNQKVLYNELEAVSVFYSDPSNSAQETLRSFQGFVMTAKSPKEMPNLKIIKLVKGRYLVASSKNQSELWKLFEVGYEHAAIKKIKLVEAAPLVLTSVKDNKPFFSVYFGIK